MTAAMAHSPAMRPPLPFFFGAGAGAGADGCAAAAGCGAGASSCLAPHEAAGEAFNIAFGGREYLIDIYNGLTAALGVDIAPHFGPDRKGDIKHSNADISKARRLLGYDPDYSFKDGIKLAIEWYKENL